MFRLLVFLSCWLGTCFSATFFFANTSVGTGTGGNTGDNGPAWAAQLRNPWSLAEDTLGNLYLSDSGNDRIRKVWVATNKITLFAGSNRGSRDGPATSAQFDTPLGLWMSSTELLFVADSVNHRIRTISPSGIVATYGGGASGNGGDGLAISTSTKFNTPSAVMGDPYGTIHIVDTGNNRVRCVDTNNIVRTCIGGGTQTGDNIAATSASLSSPQSIWITSAGVHYIAESGAHRIRRVTADNLIATVAGIGTKGSAGNNGPATSAQLNAPAGVWVNTDNSIYIADYGNHLIRSVDGRTGIIEILAGTGTGGTGADTWPTRHLPP